MRSERGSHNSSKVSATPGEEVWQPRRSSYRVAFATRFNHRSANSTLAHDRSVEEIPDAKGNCGGRHWWLVVSRFIRSEVFCNSRHERLLRVNRFSCER